MRLPSAESGWCPTTRTLQPRSSTRFKLPLPPCSSASNLNLPHCLGSCTSHSSTFRMPTACSRSSPSGRTETITRRFAGWASVAPLVSLPLTQRLHQRVSFSWGTVSAHSMGSWRSCWVSVESHLPRSQTSPSPSSSWRARTALILAPLEASLARAAGLGTCYRSSSGVSSATTMCTHLSPTACRTRSASSRSPSTFKRTSKSLARSASQPIQTCSSEQPACACLPSAPTHSSMRTGKISRRASRPSSSPSSAQSPPGSRLPKAFSVARCLRGGRQMTRATRPRCRRAATPARLCEGGAGRRGRHQMSMRDESESVPLKLKPQAQAQECICMLLLLMPVPDA
mmetsp:Transcript_7018/g.20285  ORF Transcript_7018/g.20285 Transcript_7018/m.20285 type:complete len:342 (+) Transcript_7018:1166-2191(+)